MAASSVLLKSAAAATSVAAAAAVARSEHPKALVRWGARHGLGRAVNRVAARTSDPYGRYYGDPAIKEYPYDFYDEIRAAGALVPGRFATLTARYDVVADIVRSPQFLSGFPDETLPRPVQAALHWATDPAVRSGMDRPGMLVTNGPDHARFRRLAMKAFTARAVAALRERVDEIAVEVLDEMERTPRPDGAGDVIAEFADVLPVYVIAHILGVPGEMRRTFQVWTAPAMALTDLGIGYSVYRRAEAGIRDMNVWFVEHLDGLRRNPGDDFLSRMLVAAAEETAAGGPEYDSVGLLVNATTLFVAGFETTVNLIGNGARLLMAHPEQLQGLLEDPAGWPNAVEEVLRWDPPAQHTYRYPAEDLEFHGVPLRRGRFVLPLLAGANRDPAVFADPHAFDVTRTNARDHLAFSVGPHFCVGAALARLEGEIALRRLFERYPAMAPAGDPVRRITRGVRGFAKLPVQLGAATPASGSALTVRQKYQGKRDQSAGRFSRNESRPSTASSVM